MGSTGSSVGAMGVSGQIQGSRAGVDATSLTDQGELVSRQQGWPKGWGRKPAQGPRSPRHQCAEWNLSVYFIEAASEEGLVSWHLWSLLLSRRMVWEKSQELLAAIQIWAGLHGWACPEQCVPPTTSPCLEAQARKVMEARGIPRGAAGAARGPQSRLHDGPHLVASSQKLLTAPG